MFYKTMPGTICLMSAILNFSLSTLHCINIIKHIEMYNRCGRNVNRHLKDGAIVLMMSNKKSASFIRRANFLW